MKRSAFIVMLLAATVAVAQPGPPLEPRIGPTVPAERGDPLRRLTPEQRERLWRSLSPEQKADLWRSLDPEQRRAMRERLGPPHGNGEASGPRRHFEGGDMPPRMTMTPEERRQMRDQVREAHRLRRERMDAERGVIRVGP
jgi:hypothetical protein